MAAIPHAPILATTPGGVLLRVRRLQSGQKSRHKLIHIKGISLPQVAAALGIPHSST